jgi:hypothetical protein
VKRVILLFAFGTAVFGCAGTLGGKTRDALREGVTGKQAELQACYAAALAKNRDAAGQVKLAVHVQSEQKTVHQVDVVESAIQDQEMQACVQRAVGGVTIPEAPSGNVEAHFVLDFQPSGEAPPAAAEGAAPAEGAEGAATEGG